MYDSPDLFANDGRMRIFKHETFFSWVLHLALVLIGPSAESVVHSVAKIDLIFQHVGYRIPRPVIRALGIQSRMGHYEKGSYQPPLSGTSSLPGAYRSGECRNQEQDYRI